MLGAVVVLHSPAAVSPQSIERAVAALRPWCHRVLVFGGPEQAGDDHRPLPRDAGELLAVTAALRQAERGHVAVLAADLAHPSSELVRYLRHVRGSFEVIAPERRDGGLQPLAALYHAALLRRAEGLLAAGERDLGPLLEMAAVRRVTVEEVAKFGEPEELLERAGQSFM